LADGAGLRHNFGDPCGQFLTRQAPASDKTKNALDIKGLESFDEVVDCASSNNRLKRAKLFGQSYSARGEFGVAPELALTISIRTNP
jgi:hypothetical protein